jgi:hypothetical protein
MSAVTKPDLSSAMAEYLDAGEPSEPI